MRSALPKSLRAALEAEDGLKWSLEVGGKHPKLYVARGPSQHLLVLSGSPSDHRAEKNNLARLRRILREI